MVEFNGTPFLKDMSISPFSNGTEAEYWHERNCDKCIKYKNKFRME